jgi:hypothetical protein
MQSNPSIEDLDRVSKMLRHVIRLRRAQAAYYPNKSDKSLKEVKSDESHMYFIGALKEVQVCMIRLRLRRVVQEQMRHEAAKVQLATEQVMPEDTPSLEESLQNFKDQAERDRQKAKEELEKQERIRGELEQELAFYMACLQLDIEGIRAQCRFFWTLYKKRRLRLSTAAALMNFGFHLLKARITEMLLKTGTLRSKLTKEPDDIFTDSDPLMRQWNEWLEQSHITADDVLAGGNSEQISEAAFEYADSHLILGIGAMLKLWHMFRLQSSKN